MYIFILMNVLSLGAVYFQAAFCLLEEALGLRRESNMEVKNAGEELEETFNEDEEDSEVHDLEMQPA